MPHRVFISHCGADHDVALDICHRIERRGVKCWIAPRDMRVGEDYLAQVSEAIEVSTAFVVVLSNKVNDSQFVVSEALQAYEQRIPTYPVRIENLVLKKNLQFVLRINHYIDAFGNARLARLEAFSKAVARRARGDKRDPPEGDQESRERIISAIGPGAAEFLAQWRVLGSRGGRVAWCWEAALGGPAWPFYRGMVLAGVGCALLVALAILVGRAANGLDGAITGFVAGWLGVALTMGLVGSAALRRHVHARVRHDAAPSQAFRVGGAIIGCGVVVAAFVATAPRGQNDLIVDPAPCGPTRATPCPAGAHSTRWRPGSIDWSAVYPEDPPEPVTEGADPALANMTALAPPPQPQEPVSETAAPVAMHASAEALGNFGVEQ